MDSPYNREWARGGDRAALAQVLALLNNDPSVASVHGMKATMVRRPFLSTISPFSFFHSPPRSSLSIHICQPTNNRGRPRQVAPGVARLVLDLHFNSTAVAEKYLAMHDNMAAMQESMVGVTSEEETRKVFLGCSQQLYALIALEVDRLEHVVRSDFPEFKYIDIEPM